MIYIVPVSVTRQFFAAFRCACLGLIAMIGATETNRVGWQVIFDLAAILLWIGSLGAVINGCRLAAAKVRTVFWWGD
jgi:hypothetical protein